jgi:tetratricopeptide (TPR) repeat protein
VAHETERPSCCGHIHPDKDDFMKAGLHGEIIMSRLLCIVLMALALSISTGAADADEWSECNQRDKSDEQARIAACSHVVEQNTESKERLAEAYASRGAAFDNLNEFDKAIADAEQSMLLNPSYARAYIVRGGVYFQKESYARAAADFSEAIRLTPSAEAYLGRGYVLGWLGKHEQGLADLDEALRLDAENPMAHYVRGWLRSLSNDYDGSLADASNAARLDDEKTIVSVLVHFLQGSVYQHKGDIGRAVAAYRAVFGSSEKDKISFSFYIKDDSFGFTLEQHKKNLQIATLMARAGMTNQIETSCREKRLAI